MWMVFSFDLSGIVLVSLLFVYFDDTSLRALDVFCEHGRLHGEGKLKMWMVFSSGLSAVALCCHVLVSLLLVYFEDTSQAVVADLQHYKKED